MALQLSDDLRYIKGVGEARMKLYNKLGLHTVEELLYHLPRSYLDLRHPLEPETAPIGELVPVVAIVSHKSGEQRLRRGLSLFKVTAVSAHGLLELTFYNAKYTVQALREGQEYIFYGRVGGSLLRREMQSPAVYPATAAGGLVPVYPATAGLTARMISANLRTALEQVEPLTETLPEALLAEQQLEPLDAALRELHHPRDPDALARARKRLVFEELLCLGLGLATVKRGRRAALVTPMQVVDMDVFFAALPFTPTEGQLAAIRDSARDMCSGHPMNRLIQGDVGSGKTLVAAACCYFATRNGCCSAMMAPTELLAEQHYHTLTALLGPLGLRVGLLTGSMSVKQKRAVNAALAAGQVDVMVGTHALLTADTDWPRLGLCITDEQHRFGVAQRMTLSKKSRQPHTLVMSATPIPRTLGLILYGDLEVSVIRELPRGRQPIESYLIDSAKHHRALGYLRQHFERGLQGYLVCPLVEQDEEEEGAAPALPERKSAVEHFAELQQGELAGYRLGLLHGRMKPKDKDAVMRAFAAGELDLLVATTVIEVGIDVPNACIILIENAECFGLSQLHQLRGRVGRGSQKSTCILCSDAKAPETLDRLRTLCKTTDGFAIAEYDLSVRGPGDFFGTAQHGLPALRVASLTDDLPLLEQTRELADQLLSEDPELHSLPRLHSKISRMMQAASVL